MEARDNQRNLDTLPGEIAGFQKKLEQKLKRIKELERDKKTSDKLREDLNLSRVGAMEPRRRIDSQPNVTYQPIKLGQMRRTGPDDTIRPRWSGVRSPSLRSSPRWPRSGASRPRSA